MSRWLLKLSLMPPLALGAVAVVWLVISREAPERHPPVERAVAVRVMEVPVVAVGAVEP
jgi:hypothetical protein